jgi:hypothetical protein
MSVSSRSLSMVYPLGDLEIELQGSDPELHITFTEHFANVVDSVYLLNAAGYRHFRVKRAAAHAAFLILS